MAITVTSEVKCNELTQVTTVDSSQDLFIFNESSNAGMRINYENLANAILDILTTKQYTVNSANQTLIDAIEAVQANIATEKQSIEDILSPTGIGSYGSVWDNSTSLQSAEAERNNAVHLVYAASGSALSDKPSVFDSYNNTIVMYRREHSVVRNGEDVTEAIVTLTEILPINGREWISTYRNDTWSDWIPSNKKFIQSGRTSSVNVTKATYVDQPITFPIEFPEAPLVVVGIQTGSTGVGMGNVNVSVAHGTVTTTGFSARIFNNDTSNRSPQVTWIAVG